MKNNYFNKYYGNNYDPYYDEEEEENEDEDEEENSYFPKYAKGGSVDDEDLSLYAELLKKQGRFGDTELAHINPIEAQILESLGGSGTINPNTGLKEYFLPALVAIASVIGTGYGIHQGEKAKKQAKKQNKASEDDGYFSKFLNNTGERFGQFEDYLSDPINLLNVGTTVAGALKRPKKSNENRAELEYLHSSKESPEQLADAKKRYRRALMLTDDEIYEQAAYKQALERAAWEARNNLPRGGTLDIPPIYRKDNDEEEYKKKGRWFEYYNNPEFKVDRLHYKKGGHVDGPIGVMEIIAEKKPIKTIEIEEEHTPHMLSGLFDLLKDVSHEHSGFVDGDSGGQDDDIEARVSPGEYIIDAETVASIGDGNNKAGAKKLDDFVRKIRSFKRNSDIDDIPNKTQSLLSYLG